MFKFALLVLLPAVFLAQPNSFNQAVEALFNAIDINDDRRIVIVEAEGYFLAHDVDANDNITQHEFSQALDHTSFGFRGHEAEVYAIFDQDNSGHINKADVDAVFHKADNNSDNHITNAEFHAFLHAVSVIVG